MVRCSILKTRSGDAAMGYTGEYYLFNSLYMVKDRFCKKFATGSQFYHPWVTGNKY
jgi:hypothetical protein